MKLLITGATGNIGKSVLTHLSAMPGTHKIIAGVRDISKARQTLSSIPVEYRTFDFENVNTYDPALDGIDCVFLLRPPQLSQVKKYFYPLIQAMKNKGILKTVFLSVQGVEKSSVIPHYKIEKYIESAGLNYVFLRPSYFMQNLTTTLLQDIRTHTEIIVPAGNALFNWVDVEDIAQVASIILLNFQEYAGQKIEITGLENINFETVVQMINALIGTKIQYKPLHPLHFMVRKLKDKIGFEMILVMILLHYLPRFSKEPVISQSYQSITGKPPTSFNDFILREKNTLTPFGQPLAR